MKAAPVSGRGIRSGRDKENNEAVVLAKKVLGGCELPFDEMVSLAERLKALHYFGYARRIFSLARRMPASSSQRIYLAQQHARCTYKDQNLPSAERAGRALEILDKVANMADTENQQTLGLAGEIYGFKWTTDGQSYNLERSLAYYLRAYQAGIEGDLGYSGINAAFLLDQIALQEELKATRSDLEDIAAGPRRNEARRIREEIATQLQAIVLRPGSESLVKKWRTAFTIAEACFGLQRYEEARHWLEEALAFEVTDWELESAARRLARLAYIQNNGDMPKDSAPYRTLRAFLGNDAAALRSIVTGKVGLSLSGGGFRASLFHVGVLARLAEQDLLRHVEVLSCVSGGSILGAHYYLELKKLLEAKADAEITREDYVALVQRIETDFLVAVQANLRTRVAANPWISLKTLFLPHYTWTDRLGELIEKLLYARVAGRKKIFIDELLVHPKDCPEDFAPKLDNWRRRAKVPILILNATTLNTGHNWQFTASWMGEPPSGLGPEGDGSELMRRMYYWEAPENHRSIRLGRAVAASACVPGLFEPIEFRALYPKRTIRLVDGGVHDNQGVGGLAEHDCSVLIISDASGQVISQEHPSPGPFNVPLRASRILTARVRETKFRDLTAHRRSLLLKTLTLIRLKKGMNAEPTDLIDWVDCSDSFECLDDTQPDAEFGSHAGSGITRSIQHRLAAIRTDLDSFSDVEAFSLMLSGYRMAENRIALCGEIPVDNLPAVEWRFLTVEQAMNGSKGFEKAQEDLLNILDAGASSTFKIWQLSRGMRCYGKVFCASIAVMLFIMWPGFGPARALVEKSLLLAAALLIIPVFQFFVFFAVGAKKPFMQLLTGFFISTVGWVAACVHLWLFDPGFLEWGRVRNGQFSGIGSKTPWWRPLVATFVIFIIVYLGLRF